jgi:hypothetical protein
MKNRLAKRHKRQVSRAKEKVKVSEPDVRTFEELQAARDASRAPADPRSGTNVPLGARSSQQHSNTARSPAKADA